MDSLQRFHQAQANPHAGFTAALAEIRSGAKRGHWIWYIFPQLAGLGSSSTAQAFALRDADEAVAYLRDPVLSARLAEITDAVREQLARGVRVETLMGSDIDAMKLVSSLTLFQSVGERVAATEPAHVRELADAAADVLRTADRQGYPPCAFTVSALRRTPGQR